MLNYQSQFNQQDRHHGQVTMLLFQASEQIVGPGGVSGCCGSAFHSEMPFSV
jgi:hypothetical protein